MRYLIVGIVGIVWALLVSGCAVTLNSVEKSIEKPDFNTTLRLLEKITPTPPQRLTLLYRSAVMLYETPQTQQILDALRGQGADFNAPDKSAKTLMDYAKQKHAYDLIDYLIANDFNLTQDDALLTYAYENNNSALATKLYDARYAHDNSVALMGRALQERNFMWVKFFMERGVALDSDPQLLRRALDNDDMELANFLLNNGWDIHSDKTLLTHVIKKAHVTHMTYLIASGFDVDADPELMRYVIKREDYPLAQYLIANGATLFAHDDLMEYALAQQNYEMISFLVKHGVALKVASGELVRAISAQQFDFAKMLIHWGVKLDNGMTPLTFAAFLHNRDAMIFFLSKGHDIDERDRHGRTPIMYVADDFELVDFLIHQKADLNKRDTQGRTPLMYAAGNFLIAKNLITHYANIHLLDFDKRNLLMYATSMNNRPFIEFLLDQGIDPNTEDRYGKRTLAYSNDLNTTKYLMENKARY